MTIKLVNFVPRLAKVAGFAAFAYVAVTGAALAAGEDGGWTLNIDNAGNALAVAGAEVPYVFKIENNDNYATPATKITFTLPASTVYLGVSGLEGCAPQPVLPEEVLTAPMQVTCDVPALQPQELVENITVKLRPMEDGVIELNAQMAAPGPSQVAQTTVDKGADLAVEVSLAKPEVQAGADAHFTATVTNNGPYPSNGARVVLPLPAGLSRNVKLPAGCSISGNNIICNIPGPIAAGQSVPFDFSAQVTAENQSTITISAKVETVGGPEDPVSENNEMAVNQIIIPGTDVSLSKTRSPSGLILTGSEVSFTLTPAYAGTMPEQAIITDVLPENYEFISVTAGQGWVCADVNSLISCEFTAGEGADYKAPIIIKAKAVKATDKEGVTNTAIIASKDETKGFEGNNTATDGKANIADPKVDLVAYKSGPDRNLVTVGNEYDFRLSTTNQGNIGFHGLLTITDFLPAGLTVNKITVPSGWSCSPDAPVEGPQDIVCTTDQYTEASPLQPGVQTPAIVLTAKVTSAGTINNSMLVSFPDYEEKDANPDNNRTSTGDITSADDQNWADVSIEKTVVNSPVLAGDPITFRLEVRNDGPKEALNVKLEDRFKEIVAEKGGVPQNIDFTILPGVATGLACTQTASSGYSRDLFCDIDKLPVCKAGDDCPVIEVTVRPGSQGLKTNVAEAYSITTPDNNLKNNESSATYEVTPRTDVTVEKSSPSAQGGARAGQEMLYVLAAKVIGNGLSNAEKVVVTDTLPDGLVFVSAQPSVGLCSKAPDVNTVTKAGNNQIICELGTINNGSQQTVSVRVIPVTDLTGETIINTVSVETKTPEINTENNSASLPVKILPPQLDLLITKSDDPDPVEIDTDTTYTVTVTNRGPSDAFNVDIIDTLPKTGLANPRITQKINAEDVEGEDYVFENLVADQAGGTLTYKLPYLKAGSSVHFKMAMKGILRGKHENIAEVKSDETRKGYETILGNNIAKQDTTVRVRSDISVVKTPSIETVDLREEFSWDITIENKTGPGLDVAENVKLQDILPEGMVLTRLPEIDPANSAYSCQAVVGGRDINCEFGDLAVGTTIKVKLYTKVTDKKAETASNTATVTTDSFDKHPENNTSTGTVNTVYGSSISGKVFRDFNDDGIFTSGHDSGIGNVLISLTGTATHDGATINKTIRTKSNGVYDFSDLPPGTYDVFYTSVAEKNLEEGKALPGQSAETSTAVGNKRIDHIVITGGKDGISGTNQDFTLIPQARIELTKTVGEITYQADGSYAIPYTLTIKNPSLEPLVDIKLQDVLGKSGRSFGTYTASATPAEGEYTIKDITTTFGTLKAGFTGAGDGIVLTGGKLGANNLNGNESGTSGTVKMTVLVHPVVPVAMPVTAHANAAHVAAMGEYSYQNVKKDASADARPAFAPKIELKKTHSYTPEGDVAQVGDIVKYSFTVKNTGNVPLINIKLTDKLPGLEGLENVVLARLDPQQSDDTTFSATYALTQEDLDNGKVLNTATATGEWSSNGDTDKVSATANDTVANLSKPKLELVKELESSGTSISDPTRIGDPVRYKFTVTNTGNTVLNDVTISDKLAGVTADPDGAFLLGTMQPQETKVVYAKYAVVLSDINAGEVHNIAKASGTSGPSKTPVTTDPSEVKVPLFRNPKLELAKVLKSDAPENPRVGDLLTWTVTAKNTGNVTLYNLVLSDDFGDAKITPASFAELAPDASADFTVTAPLKQSDIDAGEARNIAKIDFTDPTGPQPPVDSNEVVTPLPQKPAIALKKTGDIAALSNPPKVGEVITYTMIIRNTGNVALKAITLTDELEDFVLNPEDAQRLSTVVLLAKNPENSIADTEITVRGTYALKAADIDAGKVTNIAETTGTSVPNPDETVKDTSGTEFENDDPSITDLTRDPQIRLIKTITNAALSTPPKAGDVITFGFEIRNTGNVTISNIRLEDQVAGVVVHNISGWKGPLAAGEINTDAFTATYSLTQEDIDKGSFANTAKVIGSSVGGTPDDVSDISGTDIENDEPTVQPLDKLTGLTIVKSETHALSTPPKAGDVITYSFVVTNTGNVTLSNVVVTDPLPDLIMQQTEIATLLPGEANAVTLTGTYAVKQSDIQKGEVKNQATVTGTHVNPDKPDEPETVPPADSNEVVVPLDQVPAIAVVKSAVSALTEPAEEGQLITYTFTVINTGNMELTDVKVEDPLPGVNPSSFGVDKLAPGEEETFTATYAITLDDIDNEQVVNQATATGTYDGGNGPDTVTDLSGPDIHTDEPLIVPVVPPVPELKIIKTGTWNDENGNGYPEVGEKIDYSFEITNTGNAILFNVSPADIGPSFNNKAATAQLSAFTPAPVTLKPNETQTFTATYAMTQEDIDAAAGIVSAVNNIATAKGTVRSGKEYESPESAAKVTLPATEPNDVIITKQAMLRQVKRGERVPYIIRVENGSSSNAGPVTVIDTMPAGFRYVEDSATVDDKPFIPVVNGRQIRFENLPLGPKATLEIRVDLLVLSTAGPGKHTNIASVTDKTGTPVAKDAKAVVEIIAEPVFDCGDIVGKVFDDKNRNGYQDEGEPGLPGVRIATAKGWLVTTDEHGRFHVACAALPDQRIGSNFIMKLDTRTLPSGYRLTTENPRVVRLTAGKMTKLNFGASVGRVVRLDVQGDAFEANSTALKQRWMPNVSALIEVLRKEPSVLRLSYVDATTKPELAKQRIRHLRDLIAERWRKDGERYQLEIETRSQVGK